MKALRKLLPLVVFAFAATGFMGGSAAHATSFTCVGSKAFIVCAAANPTAPEYFVVFAGGDNGRVGAYAANSPERVCSAAPCDAGDFTSVGLHVGAVQASTAGNPTDCLTLPVSPVDHGRTADGGCYQEYDAQSPSGGASGATCIDPNRVPPVAQCKPPQ